MAQPFPVLCSLSPSKQNTRPSPPKGQTPYVSSLDCDVENATSHKQSTSMASTPPTSSSSPDDYHNESYFSQAPPMCALSPTTEHNNSLRRSPVKYRLQDDTVAMDSPPDSPAQSTIRVNEGMIRAIGASISNNTVLNEDMSTIHQDEDKPPSPRQEAGDTSDLDITLGLDKTIQEDTFGDLSTISAIPTDLTRFANLGNSPTKTIPLDGWTPRPNRNSIALSTPATGQRPLHLLSRRSTSSNEDDEATPRKARHSADSPTDLMDFTGQMNILAPPPASAPRTTRRSPSGRGAFPIRVNPTPSHRSQASVDRERASGRSPQKPFPDQQVPATPASSRQSVPNTTSTAFGLDLLDIDIGPMATPRSIPTVTPRELETLRSELQSRISGLEATLSGKEAEVHALKRAITDAEVRAGRTSEELRTERLEKEDLQNAKDDLDHRVREMEDVLREVKQNAFVEEREREKLKKQAEEAEQKTEECEVKILELNASLETLRFDRVTNSTSPMKQTQSAFEPSTPGSNGTVDVDAAVKNATETVARELHALYKSKHERKVADLKLSYEKRWIKQVDALKAELKESQGEVSRLLRERGATISGVILPSQSEALSKMEGQIEELRRWNEDLAAQKKAVEAELAGVKSELDTTRRENDMLRVDLESERVEKGELVSQVEMFLTVSTQQEIEREREREAREARDLERQPVSPPRSDASGDSNISGGASYGGGSGTVMQIQSPNKARTVNGAAVGMNGRPRPMSMLAKPMATKFGSGIPGPGMSGLKAPVASVNGARIGMYGRGTLMDGITRMGAGSR